MDAAELEEFSRTHVQAAYFEAPHNFRLFPNQAEAVATYEQYGCMFANVGVGRGKTLISLMIANAAYARGCERMLLLLPPEVVAQLVVTDIPWARTRVAINYPIYIVAHLNQDQRRALCASGRKGLYIMPYSLMSTKDTSENLIALKPQIIIADECHRLAKKDTARTRRFLAMWDSTGKGPQFVPMSGTITKKSIRDYHHLMQLALKNRSPLPHATSLAWDWAALIDADASKPDALPVDTTPIIPLVSWAKQHFPAAKAKAAEAEFYPEDVYGFRRAFQARLNSCPGVVATLDDMVGTSLLMQNEPIDPVRCASFPGWAKLTELTNQVNDMWLTPSGDEIDHAIHKWKWLNELSCGFYNELIWPTPEALATRAKSTDVPMYRDILTRAQIHHDARQMYARELRIWLGDHARDGLDTPWLVGQHCYRHSLGKDSLEVSQTLYQYWKDAKDLDFKGRPDRDSRAVRVCNYKIATAARRAMEIMEETNQGVVLWYYHQEVGTWLTETLQAYGADVLHCPAGPRYDKMLTTDTDRLKRRILVLSIEAHKTGKNLQFMQNQYYVQWPRDATTAEQSLGRLHREGQLADELIVHMNNSNMFDDMNFAACLNDSLYVHQTTGTYRKVIYASYAEPRPRIFPQAVLIQQGLDALRLDSEHTAALAEKFGGK
jgi:hypothetical protein